MKKQEPFKIDERRKYLLSRIPHCYNLREREAIEPSQIKTARKLITKWDKQQSRSACKHNKRMEALLRKAREAVYFSSPQKALAIIRQCEKMLRKCD